MAISTIGTSGGNAVGLPVGASSVVKQVFSSSGVLAYSPNLPAATYLVNVSGNAATNMTVYGTFNNTVVGGTSGQTTAVVTTASPTTSVSLYALGGVAAPAATQATIGSAVASYGAATSLNTMNNVFKFMGRIFTCSNIEREVFSIPDNGSTTATVRKDYIGTTYSNQLSAGAASPTVAVVTSTGPNTNAAYSTNGSTWTTYSAPFSSLSKLIFGNLFLGMTSGSTTYYTSTDGFTWTARTSPVAFSSVLWDGSIYLASPNSASQTWYKSTDGINWTTQAVTGWAQSGSYTWNNITFDGGIYYAQYSSVQYYSTSITTQWTSVSGVTVYQPFHATKWFSNLVFIDSTNNSRPPYSWLVPPSATATGATATSLPYIGAVVDSVGRYVTVEKSSTTYTFKFSSATTYPALFTIATTNAEVLN
jgi:hypothetical protein